MKTQPKKAAEYDLVVVGAGFCGSVLAIKADDLGLKVRAIDTQARYPDHFRAEKLETDQYEALAGFDLIDRVRPKESPPIDRVHTFTGGNETVSAHRLHRGINYADTVNSFRSVLEERQLLEIRKVSQIHDDDVSCRIEFDDETSLQARLVVLATGMGAGLRKSLRLESSKKENLVSTTFGFDTELRSAAEMPFSAINIRPHKLIKGLHYVTFFPVGERLRVNLFTCWEPHSEEAKRFRASPMDEIRGLFPDLERRVGSFRVATEVQAYTTRYYRQNAGHLRRTVLVGDAYQSVSPATGTGLSKCLVDAQVLWALLPGLLADPDARVDLGAYYRDERKARTDDEARYRWQWSNESATSQSLKTRFRKLKMRVSTLIRKVVRQRHAVDAGKALPGASSKAQ